MPIQTAVEIAHQNYEAAISVTKPVLRLIDSHGYAPDFRYGQSIFVIEGLTVTELKVYNFDREKVYAVRWNGIRTSIARDKVIFLNEKGATDALNRMKGAGQ